VAQQKEEGGSIIVVLATDAPLLPIQCQRLARRATTGLAWVGGTGNNGSGDIFVAFSTANHICPKDKVAKVCMLAPNAMSSLFRAAAEATEEAILNALCMADTMLRAGPGGLGGRRANGNQRLKRTPCGGPPTQQVLGRQQGGLDQISETIPGTTSGKTRIEKGDPSNPGRHG
jgi:L-aminopeptidase/D-esterase-like protein